jgi:hypothetical protein
MYLYSFLKNHLLLNHPLIIWQYIRSHWFLLEFIFCSLNLNKQIKKCEDYFLAVLRSRIRVKFFYAARAQAPTLLYSKTKFLNLTKV